MTGSSSTGAGDLLAQISAMSEEQRDTEQLRRALDGALVNL